MSKVLEVGLGMGRVGECAEPRRWLRSLGGGESGGGVKPGTKLQDPSSPGSENPPHSAIVTLPWASFKDCVLGSLGRAGRWVGAGASCSPICFSGGTQICRVPGPELRPSLPRSCEAGRRSSGPSLGKVVPSMG